MPIKIYNTRTRRKEELHPLEEGMVKMYVCGITPYDKTHLGHGRAYVVFDVVKRYLQYCGHKVTHVQNFTDVDDKIIQKSEIRNSKSEATLKFESGNSKQKCKEIAEKNIQAYFDVMDKLNVLRADEYPKATQHIPEMIEWIEGLVEKGYAYQLEDGVYFEVEKFKDYGKLSGRKLDDMEAGARVGVDAKKKNPYDFALWKKSKEGELAWESPWGLGRPGWHIECSAMSTKYLGDQFDIHGGGQDLEFPHHENEIAQTEALTGKVPWVKYWMHNGFVNVNKEKMSKSLGNFFALKDIFKQFDPMVVRLFLLMTHYRSPINFSDAELISAKEAYNRLCQFMHDVEFMLTHPLPPSFRKRGGMEASELDEHLQVFKDKFKMAMDDDFNSAGAIAAIFDLVKHCRKTIDEGGCGKDCLNAMRTAVIELCAILGLQLENKKENIVNVKIQSLVEEREIARKNKNFTRADEIRKELDANGYILEDTAYGTKWLRKPV